MNPITQNHYLYTHSNPVMYVDPSGNFVAITTAIIRVSFPIAKRIVLGVGTQAGRWLGNNALRLSGNITRFSRHGQVWLWVTRIRTLRKIPSEMRGSGSLTRQIGMTFRQNVGRRGEYTIRIMKGRPNAPNASQRVDYVKINRGTPIGRNGVPQSSGNTADAHIPLSEWLSWTRWYAP